MPTEDSYREAAEALRKSADRVEDDVPPVNKDWSDAVQGGRLAELIPDAVAEIAADATSVVGKIRDLADVCDGRAQQCLEYEGKVRKYNQDLENYYIRLDKYEPGSTGIKPQAPEPPAAPPAWLESRVPMAS